MDDLLKEVARARREEIHWLAASSAFQAPEVVMARWAELERKAKKDARLDDFIAEVSRRKRAREAASSN